MHVIHPSKHIIGSKNNSLKGKKIILCITGSSAAFKCPEIARELMKRGAEVQVAMSQSAQQIISAKLMEWATGNKVICEITGEIEHITLLETADLVLVAPTTANTLSKIANGVSDTVVTLIVSSALGLKIPVVIVPAMHKSLYQNPLLQMNMKTLKQMGVDVIYPRIEEDKAKIAETIEIVERVKEKLLKNKKTMEKELNVLITAGPTREYLDEIRYLTNPSSGKMGFTLAEEAVKRGFYVKLIHGPTHLKPPEKADSEEAVTTGEMYDKVLRNLKKKPFNVVILAAAPLDFGFKEKIKGKIPSNKKVFPTELVSLPKISDEIRKVARNIFFVGFKAEYNVSKSELIERAYRKLRKAKMNLIIANDVSKKDSGFSSDFNEVYIIDEKKKVIEVPLKPKKEVAEKIFDVIMKKIQG